MLFILGTAVFVVLATGPRGATSTPTPTNDTSLGTSAPTSTTTGGASPSPTFTGQPTATASGGSTPTPSATPTGEPTPTPTAPIGLVEVEMPFVPVIGFWDQTPSVSLGQLTHALEGGGSRWARVMVPADDRDDIAAALGITLDGGIESGDPEAIRDAVNDGALGLLRAADVTATVHALGIGDARLFGVERMRDLAAWPLTIRVKDTADRAWDQSRTWTMIAGGDMILDRGPYERIVNRGLGQDYVFDGGTAEVTGRHCCGSFTGYGEFDVPEYRKTGHRGLMRDYLKSADLTIANLENPTPDDWIFHVEGTPFSGKPELLQIFTDAGFDFVSIANNHMADYGASGIKDTRRHLPEYGLKFAGAGRDIEEAAEYEILEVNGTRLAILPCVAVVPSEWADGNRAGSMPCTDERFVPNITRAATEADFVIVFPHWGIEYTFEPIRSQRRLAADFMSAGADLILGAHPHVTQAVEAIDGKLVFYSMGNFVFDQDWAEITMEGLLVEATFQGGTLIQTGLRPTLIHDMAQPNLLDPVGSGEIVLDRMRDASLGLFP
ncbi:MAG: CapA family protein [Candidatus Limnocylindrales bacterium]